MFAPVPVSVLITGNVRLYERFPCLQRVVADLIAHQRHRIVSSGVTTTLPTFTDIDFGSPASSSNSTRTTSSGTIVIAMRRLDGDVAQFRGMYMSHIGTPHCSRQVSQIGWLEMVMTC